MKSLSSLMDAALGKTECDLSIEDVTYLDVFHCKWRKGSIFVKNGIIVGIEPGLKSKRKISAKDKYLVPGFIDAHVHIESSLLIPDQFEKTVLPKGTTTAVCDPHEIANVMGIDGINTFLDHSEIAKMNMMIMLSSCVPATHLETNGAGVISAKDLIPFKNHNRTLGLAEMMNVPGVLNSDPTVHDKINSFSDVHIDGHSPLLRGNALSAYIAAGINSCHESSELEEAIEKLQKGMSVWIREGSVAKDLKTLIPLLSIETSTSLGFCTDDRNPLDIFREGHIDHLIRESIKKGVRSEIAYRTSSWSVARHYGLDRNSRFKFKIGAIAPGFTADLCLLNDANTCSISKVFKTGIETSELNFENQKNQQFKNTIRAKPVQSNDLIAPEGMVHVIGVIPGKIITDSHVLSSDTKGIAKLSVLERHGKGLKPSNAYVLGFGESLNGAIASSVGHDSHNLIAVSNNTKDMAIALNSLIQCGGGFSVVQNGSVIAKLELPFAGLMSMMDAETIKLKLETLHAASKSIGCVLDEPFLQLAFLSLPVIPKLKLTDRGLVDVNRFDFIPVRAS